MRLVPDFSLGEPALTIAERKLDLVELEKFVEFIRLQILNAEGFDDEVEKEREISKELRVTRERIWKSGKWLSKRIDEAVGEF